MSGAPTQSSTGDGDRGGAEAAANDAAQHAYFCAAANGTQGSYDGFETWSVHVAATRSPQQQVGASLHERLHHELQHTSPWGLLGRFALDLARQGIQGDRFGRLFRFCRDAARTVHETYATTLTVGGEIGGEEHLGADYVGYLTTGRALAVGLPWESGRFRVDAVLRCCMAPARLSDLAGQLASTRIADLDHPDARPDRRLARLHPSVVAAVPAPETFGLHGSPSPAELDRYYSVVAETLAAVGIPTMDAAAVRHYIEALINDVIDLSPAMGARISVDDTRESVTDDLQEHARERLYLHPSPLPAELVEETELPRRAEDFARHHPRLGIHTLLVWMPASQLAKQFTGLPVTGHGPYEAPQLGVLAAGKDSQGGPCARLSFIADMDPGPFVRSMTVGTVVLTTASALMVSPADTDFGGVDPLLVMVDGPVLPRILDRYAGQVGLMWDVYEVTGDRHLYAVVVRMTVLTNYVWIAVTGEAGRSYLKAWLEALGEDQARRQPTAFSDVRGHLDAAIRHIVETWWYLGQESETLFDAIGG